jgi:hypothetical protein
VSAADRQRDGSGPGPEPYADLAEPRLLVPAGQPLDRIEQSIPLMRSATSPRALVLPCWIGLPLAGAPISGGPR